MLIYLIWKHNHLKVLFPKLHHPFIWNKTFYFLQKLWNLLPITKSSVQFFFHLWKIISNIYSSDNQMYFYEKKPHIARSPIPPTWQLTTRHRSQYYILYILYRQNSVQRKENIKITLFRIIKRQHFIIVIIIMLYTS